MSAVYKLADGWNQLAGVFEHVQLNKDATIYSKTYSA